MQNVVPIFLALAYCCCVSVLGQTSRQTFLGPLPTVTRWSSTTTTITTNVLPTCLIIDPNDNLRPCPVLQGGRGRALEQESLQPSPALRLEPTASPSLVPASQDPQVQPSYMQETEKAEYRIDGLPSDCFPEARAANPQERNLFGRPTLVRIVSRTTTLTSTVTNTVPILGNNRVGLRLGGCVPVDPPLPFSPC